MRRIILSGTIATLLLSFIISVSFFFAKQATTDELTGFSPYSGRIGGSVRTTTVLTEKNSENKLVPEKLPDMCYAKEDAVAIASSGEKLTLAYATELSPIGLTEDGKYICSFENETISVSVDNTVTNYKLLNPPIDTAKDCLEADKGVFDGPSGKETYYNMRMNYVVVLMEEKGYSYDYWVRADGVKMYGPYVMVAANVAVRPKGTVLPTSRGMGIVVDACEAASNNPSLSDIAVNWGYTVDKDGNHVQDWLPEQ